MEMIGALEKIAIASGIISVWFSKKGNIWVYPIGILSTIIYIYLSFVGDLFGEATVNFYYTIMSVYGWYNWMRQDADKVLLVRISSSSSAEWRKEILFFIGVYIILFFALQYIKDAFAPGAIPWADALASASAFTGMWLMAKKKVNSWIWWIITNVVSVPLYYIKGYDNTSLYYLILLVLAILGLIEWRKKADEVEQH
jgi:nicotinamide mononucleotide transporter